MNLVPPVLEAALRARYAGRPDTIAHVLANAKAWERLKVKSRESSPYDPKEENEKLAS